MNKNRFLGECSSDRFLIRGINVFKYKWENIGRVVIVIDHKTNKPKGISGYKILVGNSTIKFLAYQDANGIWSFYDIDE